MRQLARNSNIAAQNARYTRKEEKRWYHGQRSAQSRGLGFLTHIPSKLYDKPMILSASIGKPVSVYEYTHYKICHDAKHVGLGFQSAVL